MTAFRNIWALVIWRGLLSLHFVAVAAMSAGADEIKFAIAGAEETGIKLIFDDWYAREMQRQGGPGKSHGWWPWGLRAFDYDNDGDLDLMPSHHGTPHSIILKSLVVDTGRLRFVDATKALGLDGRQLPGADDRPWIWDFDGDGWLDIAGFSDESPTLSAWNQGGKRFVPTEEPLFPRLSHPREVIDLDGDGYLDLDGGYKGQWFYLPQQRTYRHEKTLRFAAAEGVEPAVLQAIKLQRQAGHDRFFRLGFLTHDYVGYDTLGYAARPIDLNDDSRSDVVIHGSGGYGAAYLGRYLIRTADGKLADRSAELGLPIDGAPILIDDLTGDGRTDVLIVGKQTGGLYQQDESGKYRRRENALSQFVQRREPYLLRASRVDLDNDGDADLVMSSPRFGRESVFENRGQGDFRQVLEMRGWDSNPIVIADLDDDGRMDVIVGGGPGEDVKMRITIYLNRTENAGNFAKILPRMPAPNPYAAGAVVEVFRPGELRQHGTRPILTEKAHPDATPIHVGLGAATTFDLRVTFPDGKQLQSRGTKANSTVTADLGSGEIRVK